MFRIPGRTPAGAEIASGSKSFCYNDNRLAGHVHGPVRAFP